VPLLSQNDFLNPIFSVNPLLLAVFVFLWGNGSLLIVAAKTKSIREVFFRSPSILLGDFFILPGIIFVVAWHYQNVLISDPFSSAVYFFFLLFGFTLAGISAVRFKQVNRWYAAHIIFYWIIAYIVTAFIFKFGYMYVTGAISLQSALIPLVVLPAILIHVLLGVLYPKRFVTQSL